MLLACLHCIAAPGDEHWDYRFGRAGIAGPVITFAWHDGQLYAAGSFQTAGHSLVHSVVRWDGTDFWPLGDGLESSNGSFSVFALASYRGLLYAGGYFDMSGSNALAGFACWNGTNWIPVTGVTGTVATLTVIKDSLYAGGILGLSGDTNLYGILRWDGTNWNTFESRIQTCTSCYDSGVATIAAYGDGLFVTGSFSKIGGVSLTNCARWNGAAWQQFPMSVAGEVTQFYSHRGDLIASGYFTSIENVAASNIARWDGTNWWPMGSGLDSDIGRLCSDGSDLYATGGFTSSGSTPLDRVARWNGIEWLPLGTNNFSAWAECYVVHKVPDGRLFLGGYFGSISGHPAGGVAQWNGTEWQSVSPGNMRGFNDSLGMDNPGIVYALAASPDAVFAGGLFQIGGHTNAPCIARLDSNGTSALGSGVTHHTPGIRALAVLGSNVIVGGQITNIGGCTVRFIAQWQDSAWSPVGSGVNSNVSALLTHGSQLYAGGIFTEAGGVPANRIAVWNGTSWNALGSGVDANVTALAWANGNLFAGGTFTNAGGIPVNGIARWDGNVWHALSTGVSGPIPVSVQAIAASGSNVYVGGSFFAAGGVQATNVAMWDGTAWHSVGDGTENGVVARVNALAVFNGSLFVGGTFITAGSQAIASLARWDGTNWSTLGTGVKYYRSLDVPDYGRVFALLEHAGDLYVGGLFTSAGGYPSYGIARWIENPTLHLDAVSQTGGNAHATIRGLAGLRYRIESSPDLSTWSDLSTGRAELDTVEVTNVNTPSGFYRARLNE